MALKVPKSTMKCDHNGQSDYHCEECKPGTPGRRDWRNGATDQEIADLNSYPAGTVGWTSEDKALRQLIEIGKEVGFGRLHQMAGHVRDVVVYNKKVKLA